MVALIAGLKAHTALAAFHEGRVYDDLAPSPDRLSRKSPHTTVQVTRVDHFHHLGRRGCRVFGDVHNWVEATKTSALRMGDVRAMNAATTDYLDAVDLTISGWRVHSIVVDVQGIQAMRDPQSLTTGHGVVPYRANLSPVT
jgi:hypothetical protein